jgi:hypothetical protein
VLATSIAQQLAASNHPAQSDQFRDTDARHATSPI